MKPFCGGDGIILKSGAIQKPIDCLHYALNLPANVVITGIDKPKILDQAFEAAKTFKPLGQEEFSALLKQPNKSPLRGSTNYLKYPHILTARRVIPIGWVPIIPQFRSWHPNQPDDNSIQQVIALGGQCQVGRHPAYVERTTATTVML